MKILSVDDSVMIRKVIRNAVEMLGYDFLEAVNGLDALSVLEEHFMDIGLILMDWNMPVLDGLSAIKKIKADERFKAIPIMMVTTEVDRQRVVQAIAAGAKNYVMKPFSSEALIIKMRETLGKGL